jgi:hypothetical protein
MPRGIVTTVYKFEELSDTAKEKAREWWREGALDHEWWEHIYDDAARMGEIIGINIDNETSGRARAGGRPRINFETNPDGARFEGSYRYRKGSVAAIKKEAPQDKDLHEIAEALARVQKKYFYDLEASIRYGRGHDEHPSNTFITVEPGSWGLDRGMQVSEADDEEIQDILRDFMYWISRQLSREAEWILSDEQVDESIIANEYEFTEDGERA